MKIRLLRALLINGEAHPEGCEVELPEELADKMVVAGWAVVAPAKSRKAPAKPAEDATSADVGSDSPADQPAAPDAEGA